jgi:hypothetical protein
MYVVLPLQRGIARFAAQEKNSASRTVISNAYFLEMYRSQIIVTSNPSNWEGSPNPIHRSSAIVQCVCYAVG